MEKEILLGLLESVLGKGKHTTKDNYKFYCPFCHHPQRKLEIDIKTNSKGYNLLRCWACDYSAKKISYLFSKLRVDRDKTQQLQHIIIPSVDDNDELEEKKDKLYLPNDFIPLYEYVELDEYKSNKRDEAASYLLNRNITQDHWVKYRIGFCTEGKYKNKIVIPSYNSENILNFFICRKFTNDNSNSHDRSVVKVREVIGLENLINWNCPIILVEGIFDAMTIQRNCIPLFGKNISEALMKRLLLSSVDKIYIALDNDAQKKALHYCELLMSYGKKVYLVEMKEKDANVIGFESFLNLLENTYPLTFEKIIELKIDYEYRRT